MLKLIACFEALNASAAKTNAPAVIRIETISKAFCTTISRVASFLLQFHKAFLGPLSSTRSGRAWLISRPSFFDTHNLREVLWVRFGKTVCSLANDSFAEAAVQHASRRSMSDKGRKSL